MRCGGDYLVVWKVPLLPFDFLQERQADHVVEEIHSRREYVLDTLGSIPQHFVALYTSRQPQCRYGYLTSKNCDSFQLGEMIYFLSRKGLLRIESAFGLSPDDSTTYYNGSIEDIIAKLRECPSYKLDEYHQHCGLRTRMLPILDTLFLRNQVYICLDCWKADKSRESWADKPVGGKWSWIPGRRTGGNGCQVHGEAKAMFTAETRNWTRVE